MTGGHRSGFTGLKKKKVEDHGSRVAKALKSTKGSSLVQLFCSAHPPPTQDNSLVGPHGPPLATVERRKLTWLGQVTRHDSLHTTHDQTRPHRKSGCCWLVGCVMSQQHASVFQGRICLGHFTRCHTEIASRRCYHTQSEIWHQAS